MLALIVVTVFLKGFKALNPDFFTKPTPQLGIGQSQGAGVANAIVGSLMIVAIATRSRSDRRARRAYSPTSSPAGASASSSD